MISTQSYSRPIAIEPKQYQPAVMDKFDKLLLRAAKNKRKDIINRYGEEGCEKLISKGKQEEKKEDPEAVKQKYQETIKNLLQSLEESPLPKIVGSPLPSCPIPKSPHSTRAKLSAISSSYPSPHATKANLGSKAIPSAWSWNLTKSPDIKSKRKRAARPKREISSRRQSLDLKYEHDPISSSERTMSDESWDTTSSNDSSTNTERKNSRSKKKTSEDMLSSEERKARRARRKELMQKLAETERVAEARTSAIQQVERGVQKKNEQCRRGSFGSNAEASRRLKNVRQAVRYWEGRGPTCVEQPRRMSH